LLNELTSLCDIRIFFVFCPDSVIVLIVSCLKRFFSDYAIDCITDSFRCLLTTICLRAELLLSEVNPYAYTFMLVFLLAHSILMPDSWLRLWYIFSVLVQACLGSYLTVLQIMKTCLSG